MAEAPYQSLYRRFRPQRFSELRGQDHVVAALLGAVRTGRVAHAYLFSGPRGTGKTSTARILAKALDCADPQDGEPCGECESCRAVASGASLDVHELDAASNNGVDAMRDLVARAALASPGDWKVYIVDEVHMLSTAASNALLKTLEEPPSHVVFVLATTDPHRVLPTIRSRTQHFEFHLLGAETLDQLVRSVDEAADLGLPSEALVEAVRRGKGSARDTLSALDQLSAAGGVVPDSPGVAGIAEAIASQDPTRALVELGGAIAAGADVERVSVELVEHLRQAFLALMAPQLVEVADPERVSALGEALGAPAVVRALEVLGLTQVELRDALDPRATLELALIRLTRPELDVSVTALVDRIDRLERRLAQLGRSAEPGGITASRRGEPMTDASRAPVRRGPARTGSEGAEPGEAATPGPPGGGHPGTAASGPGPADAAWIAGTPGPDAAPSAHEPAAPAGVPEGRAPLRAVGSKPAGAEQTNTAEADTGSRRSTQPTRPSSAGGGASFGALRTARTVRTSAPVPGQPGQVSSPVPGQPDMGTGGHAGAGGATAVLPAPGGAERGAEGGQRFPSRDELVLAWGDTVLAALPSRPRARFRAGRFVDSEVPIATFALPDEVHRNFCEECRAEVEAALSAHFGLRISLRLVVDTPGTPARRPGDGATAAQAAAPPVVSPSNGGSSARESSGRPVAGVDPGPDLGEPDPYDDYPDEDPFDVEGSTEAAQSLGSIEERVLRAFPGAEEVIEGDV